MGTTLSAVTEPTAGADIQRRRLTIGMSVAALAKAAGVDRGRLAALEAGEKVRDTTLAAVVRTLDDLEHEMGMDLPSRVEPVAAEEQKPNVIRFVVEGVYGAKALVVEGPVENIAELEAAVDRIMRRLQAGAGGNDASGG
jgi:transcriptional regulator with XRE-family HTH domain